MFVLYVKNAILLIFFCTKRLSKKENLKLNVVPVTFRLYPRGDKKYWFESPSVEFSHHILFISLFEKFERLQLKRTKLNQMDQIWQLYSNYILNILSSRVNFHRNAKPMSFIYKVKLACMIVFDFFCFRWIRRERVLRSCNKHSNFLYN